MRPSQWKELEGLERGNVTAFGLWWEDVFGKEFQSGQGTSQFGKTSKGGLFSEKNLKVFCYLLGDIFKIAKLLNFFYPVNCSQFGTDYQYCGGGIRFDGGLHSGLPCYRCFEEKSGGS